MSIEYRNTLPMHKQTNKKNQKTALKLTAFGRSNCPYLEAKIINFVM